MYALEINQVSKTYNNEVKALNNINFKLELGDFVGLLGVNGAGKTSLIAAIAGVNKFSGQIKVMGHDLKNELVKVKKMLGVVPQELAFDPFLTVRQTLELQSGLYGVRNNQAWINELIERMHLQDKINTNTRALSGGMKRRLMVAQALVHKPPLIILDEPTAGVDVEIRKSLWAFIKELHKAGNTILLTTHYLEEVENLCNQIIMIDQGRIIAQSSKQELINNASCLPVLFEFELNSANLPSNLYALVKSVDENKFVLQLASSAAVTDVLLQIHAAKIVVLNMQIIQPKLEDIFLRYLGR